MSLERSLHDAGLLVSGPEKFFAGSVAIGAYTNAAAAQLNEKGLPIIATTFNSMFLKPEYGKDFEAAKKWLQQTSSNHEGELATTEELARATFMKVMPNLSQDESWNLFKDDFVHAGLGAAMERHKATELDFVTEWRPKRSDKSLLLGIVDESSMIAVTEAKKALPACSVVVFAGDGNQLPPIDKNQSGTISVLEHLLRNQDKHRVLYTKTSHRSGTGNKIAELADEFAIYTEDAKRRTPSMQSGQARVRELVNLPGSGIEFRNSLLPEDLIALVRRQAICVVHQNVTRHYFNETIRAALRLPKNCLMPGERVFAQCKSDGDMHVRALVAKQSEWLAVRQTYGSQGTFAVAPGHHVTGRIMFEFDQRTNEPVIGQRCRGDVALAIGYARTAHKAQGSGVDTVFLHWPSVTNQHEMDHNWGRADEANWARWVYTAATRARKKVVFFNRIEVEATDSLYEAGQQALAEVLKRAHGDGNVTLESLTADFSDPFRFIDRSKLRFS